MSTASAETDRHRKWLGSRKIKFYSIAKPKVVSLSRNGQRRLPVHNPIRVCIHMSKLLLKVYLGE